MRSFKLSETPRYHFHALLAIAALAFGGLAAAAVALPDGAGQQASIPSMASLQETGNAFAAVSKKAAPAVVFIEVEKKMAPVATSFKGMPDGLDEEMLKRFFGERFKGFELPKFDGLQPPPRSLGQGSGFIISADGYILTNNHVVGGADKVRVTMADGRKFEAKTIGTDASSDVAVIKIDARDLPVLQMSNSDDLEVGRWVLAVGSPFGLPGTVTSGIISATGRSSVGIADYENFIQTDAAINPGNSGGPLVNLNGDAIGINTAIASRNGVFNGIGFAIPINMARNICDQLIETGSVSRGYLGIVIQPLTAELAKSFGMHEGAKGILVGDVTKGSPAHQAGLKDGDVIVQYNGREVSQVGEFRNRVAATAPESLVQMTVWRDGERTTFDVTIGKLAVKGELAGNEPQDTQPLGLSVRPLTKELAEKHGYTGQTGVVIANVASGSAAALAGLRPGWLIKQVNRKPVHDMDSFKAALQQRLDGNMVLLHVHTGDFSRYITLSVEG